MKSLLIAASVAAAVMTAACDRPPQPRTEPAAAGSGTTSAPRPQTGTPSPAEKREGANPTQGQVDPKESAQHKDFQQRGDAAGPTSADTKPQN